MDLTLHIAKFGARANLCNSEKDTAVCKMQIIAMAKRSKKPKAGHFLFQWREYRKMTQDELAAAVKPPTTGSVISLLESGDRGLSNKWLERLAPALKTKKGFILDMDPFETDTSILEIWGLIPEPDKARVRVILEAFTKKAG